MKNNIIILSLLLIIGCAKTHYIGEQYLGQKYILNPLGEEKSPDTDPLIRFDTFDCMTFIETSLADGNIDKLKRIRYKNGDVDFINRNHFTETDWLNNNKDIVENVSEDYGKTQIRHVVIDKQNWFKKVHNIKADIPRQTADIKYIPYDDIKDITIKEPLIVLFMYQNPKIYDKIGTDLAVIHVGFLLPNGKLRHASQKYGKVVDVDFKNYISKIKKNKRNIGIALVKIK